MFKIFGIEIYALMKDNKELGKFEVIDDKLCLKLNDGIEEDMLPYMIKLNYNIDLQGALEKWVSHRLLQRDRIGINSMLRALGIFKYNKHDLFEYSHASMMKDSYWISFSPNDTYEECTQRGKMGIKPGEN